MTVIQVADECYNMDRYLEGTWEEFEEWIRKTIGSDVHWCIPPRDTRLNREMVADPILNDIKRGNGTFLDKNAFIEIVKDLDR